MQIWQLYDRARDTNARGWKTEAGSTDAEISQLDWWKGELLYVEMAGRAIAITTVHRYNCF